MVDKQHNADFRNSIMEQIQDETQAIRRLDTLVTRARNMDRPDIAAVLANMSSEQQKHIKALEQVAHEFFSEINGEVAQGLKGSQAVRSVSTRIDSQELYQALELLFGGKLEKQTAVAKYWEIYHLLPDDFKIASPELEEQVQQIIKALKETSASTGRPLRPSLNLRKHAYIIAVTHNCPWSKSAECPCEDVLMGHKCEHKLFD